MRPKDVLIAFEIILTHMQGAGHTGMNADVEFQGTKYEINIKKVKDAQPKRKK